MSRFSHACAAASGGLPVAWRLRLHRALALAAIVGLASWWMTSSWGPWPCLWRSWTGEPCPLCGGTRALAALARGDGMEALHQHAVLTMLVLVWWWIGWPGSAARPSGWRWWSVEGIGWLLLSSWLWRVFAA